MINEKLKFIDIFCGCGGLALGFKNAGYEFQMGIDNDKASLETLKSNFPQSIAAEYDLFDQKAVHEIKKDLKDIFPDVIIGGPPCQGFSLTGPRKFNDPRNSLYISFINLVDTLRPKAFLIENVPGVRNLYNGKIFNEIESRFNSLGYNVSSEILNSAEFGVPQVRKRLFIVGLKNNFGEFNFPEKRLEPDNFISCKDAISDLPPLKGGEDLGEEISIYLKGPLSKYQKSMRKVVIL